MIWHESESPKHPQTPFKHIQTPPNLSMLALWRALPGISYHSTPTRKGSSWIYFIFLRLFNQHSLGSIQDQSDTIQKPSRHPQHNAITSVFILSVASTRLFARQSNLIRCFWGLQFMSQALRWLKSVWRVSGGFLDGVWFILDIAKTVLMENQLTKIGL